MRFILVGAAVGFALLVQPCLAQQTPSSPAQNTAAQANVSDPARLAAARRVVKANGTEATERTAIAQLMPIIMGQLGHAQGLSEAQIAEATNIATGEMQASVGELVEIIVQIYANHFSTEQLNQMADFYETPAGRAYVAEMPELLHDSMAVSQQWAQTTLVPRLTARMEAQQRQQHP